MTSVHDVAAYILKQAGPMSAMKLQKLIYYSQAWSLVWEDRPLFPERIEAWASGPVAPALYARHKGQFLLREWKHGSQKNLCADDRETVDVVLKSYGHRNAQQLSELTHREAPWKDARAGLAPGDAGTEEITHAAMAEYYSSL